MWIIGTEEGATKYSNEKYMKVKDGGKSCKLIELQDSYQLKAYLEPSVPGMVLGKSRAILMVMYERAIKKEEIEDAKRIIRGLQPMEDIVYNHFGEVDEIIEDDYDA